MISKVKVVTMLPFASPSIITDVTLTGFLKVTTTHGSGLSGVHASRENSLVASELSLVPSDVSLSPSISSSNPKLLSHFSVRLQNWIPL